MTQITGVTVTDVLNITGATVTTAQLAQAVAVIELYASVDMSNFAAFGAKNRWALQAAVVWQAAWMLSQIDYAGRTDFATQSQDGLSLTTRDKDTILLAPLARKALSRVSRNRDRTINISLGRHSAQNSSIYYWEEM